MTPLVSCIRSQHHAALLLAEARENLKKPSRNRSRSQSRNWSEPGLRGECLPATTIVPGYLAFACHPGHSSCGGETCAYSVHVGTGIRERNVTSKYWAWFRAVSSISFSLFLHRYCIPYVFCFVLVLVRNGHLN